MHLLVANCGVGTRRVPPNPAPRVLALLRGWCGTPISLRHLTGLWRVQGAPRGDLSRSSNHTGLVTMWLAEPMGFGCSWHCAGAKKPSRHHAENPKAPGLEEALAAHGEQHNPRGGFPSHLLPERFLKQTNRG